MGTVLLEQVCKRYESGALAVDRFDLAVADGEFLVLVGPSGCGKSTTLRMVAGLEAVTSGTIAIDGRRVNDVAPKDRDIAMVFQNYALYPHMTVYDNLAFALTLRGAPKREIERRVGEAAETLGLGGYLRRLPKQLSGGQRQRVALGRALVRQPRVFLFDEPLSNLDAQMRAEMRLELARLHRQLGATMIYVTHDQVEAMTLGDRIVVMERGRIQQAGRPLEVYRRPATVFVAGFIGTPPMNLVAGRLEGSAAGGLRFRCPAGDVPVAAADGALAARVGCELLLGVRPESLRLREGGGDEDAAGLWGVVEGAEAMGAETVLHLGAGGGVRFRARVPPDAGRAPGTRLGFSVEPDQLHFFDTTTGARIGPEEAACA